MVYREPQKPIRTMEKSDTIPWYVRWFTRPFRKLTVLSTEDPVCIQDGWGRKWFQNRENVWASEQYPYFTNDRVLSNQFRAAVIAHGGNLGQKTFFKESPAK